METESEEVREQWIKSVQDVLDPANQVKEDFQKKKKKN